MAEKEKGENMRDSIVTSDLILPSHISKHSMETFVNMLSDDQCEEVISMIRMKRTNDNEALFVKLPKEVWTKILCYLDPRDLVSFSSTSRNLRELGHDPQIWRHTKLNIITSDLLRCPESYSRLFSRLTKLKELNIEQNYINSGWNIDEANSLKIRQNLLCCLGKVQVESLRLDFRERTYHLNIEICSSLFKNLKKIDFDRSQIFDYQVSLIANGCPILESFSSGSASYLSDWSIGVLAEKSSNLKTFCLMDIYGCGRIEGITDKSIISLVCKNPNFQNIYLGHLPNVSDEAVHLIGEYCPNLEILGLSFMRRITDLGLRSVVTSCNKLRDLCLRGIRITDRTLELLGKHCPELEELELDSCLSVTMSGVESFVSQGSKPLKLRVEHDSIPVVYMKTLEEEYPRLI